MIYWKNKYLPTILGISILLSSCDVFVDDSKERALFSKLQVGMTKSQVLGIVGKPDFIEAGRHKSELHTYFIEKTKYKSEQPLVKFDSTGVVVYVSYHPKVGE